MRWIPPPSEVALAAVVTAAMCVDVSQAAHPLLALTVVLVAGATLAWRLAAPWLPVLVIGLVNGWLMSTAPGEFGPQTVVFGVLVATYSAAAHSRGWGAWLVGGAGLALVWWAHVASDEGDAGDFLPFLVWGVPWLAGRLVRRQTLAAHEAGARAALLEVEAQDAASRERDRIARELHDVVAHAVSLMVVQAGAERMAGVPERTGAALQAIETSGRQALVELRTMLGVLRGPADEELEPQPGLADLPSLVASLRAAGLDVASDVPASSDVPPGVGVAAYRIVQEALTNALRYGDGAASVRVAVGSAVDIEVRNRLGSGTPSGSGRGLVGMRERAELFGGRFSGGQQGDEWVVRAELPLQRVRAD